MGIFNPMTLGPLMDREWLDFKNTGSQSVPPFGVIEIAGATNPRSGLVLLSCQRPGSTLRNLYAVNGPMTVAASGFGRCTFRPTFAKYTGSAPAAYSCWGPTVDSFELTVNRPGFFATGLALTSPTRMQVFPYPITQLIGKLDGDLDADNTATMSVWASTPNTEADTSFNVTVYDWMLGAGETNSSGKKVAAVWKGGGWYVTAAECE